MPTKRRARSPPRRVLPFNNWLVALHHLLHHQPLVHNQRDEDEQCQHHPQACQKRRSVNTCRPLSRRQRVQANSTCQSHNSLIKVRRRQDRCVRRRRAACKRRCRRCKHTLSVCLTTTALKKSLSISSRSQPLKYKMKILQQRFIHTTKKKIATQTFCRLNERAWCSGQSKASLALITSMPIICLVKCLVLIMHTLPHKARKKLLCLISGEWFMN
mmetsp:Transcript_7271/g.12747  ORF Transcript_7271/g.12747 Transcript_7271/m.12747 type:complete len:215 (+) Transcript_7271:577-1221(+)